MADTAALSTTVSAADARAGVYRDAREVRARARVTQAEDSPAIQRALDRLNKVLASGQPLSHDVPRGYYLNIVV